MKVKLFLVGLLVTGAAQLFAAGESGYFLSAVRNDKQNLAEAIYSTLSKAEQDSKNIGGKYLAKYGTAPKATTGPSVSLVWETNEQVKKAVKDATDEPAKLQAKLEGLFTSTASDAYGAQVFKTLGKEKAQAAAKAISEAADKVAAKV
ncbi:MAG: hypothetical protein M1549_03970 [Candidatus Dependentiae bacterium]|nr:hypothetical protein [Candidatus Dependentiae bacterium]